MNPILFPFTWISEFARGVLFACFEKVTVLQPAGELVPEPLSRLERDGRLDIYLPDETSDPKADDDLPNLLSAYHAWADLHREERPAFHKFSQLHPRFPDDASTAWIRSKILNPEGKQTDNQSPSNGSEMESLQMARLFLAIAQEYDLQSESLSLDLHTIEDMERNLFRDLTPDQSPPPGLASDALLLTEIEAGRPMPAERLAAWRRLYAHCRGKGDSSLTFQSLFFATSDKEVLNLILDPIETPEVACRIAGIPSVDAGGPFAGTAVHQKIHEVLNGAVQGGPLSSDLTIFFSGNETYPENPGSLIIYRLKGDPVTSAPPGLASNPKSPPIVPMGGENSFTLLGYIGKTG